MAEGTVGVNASLRIKSKQRAKKESSKKRPSSSVKEDNKNEEPFFSYVPRPELLLGGDSNTDIGEQDDVVDSLEMVGEVDSTVNIVDKKRKNFNNGSTISEIKDEEVTELFNDVESGQLKKVKKTKKKKAKIDLSADPVEKNDAKSMTAGNSVHPAIDYLIMWKENRSEWSFKKARQIWLLRNIYDETKLSNKHFKMLIKYMKDLKGKSREETLAQAREVMEKPDEDGIVDSERSFQRVRAEKVLKLLA